MTSTLIRDVRLSPALACAIVVLATALTAPVRSQPASVGLSVSGTVVAADAAQSAVREAMVTLSMPAIGRTETLLTGPDGRFRFVGLPWDRFTLAAEKPGFVPTFFGSLRPGRGPAAVLVPEAGQQPPGVTIRLPRGAAISGRVTNEFGRPMPGVEILVLEWRGVPPDRRLFPVGRFTASDGRGEYRVFGLPPGRYAVALSPLGVSALAGARRLTRQDVDAALQSRGSADHAPDASGVLVGYGAQYYPGTDDPLGAELITIDLGEERSGTDFRMAFVANSALEGTIRDHLDRAPYAVRLWLVSRHRLLGVPRLGGPVGAIPVDPDGRFKADRVLDGWYTLVARASTPDAARSVSPEPDLWAQEEVLISGSNATPLRLTLRPGVQVDGVVRIGSSNRQGADLSAMRLRLTPVRDLGIASDVRTTGLLDGRFSFGRVPPGDYRLEVLGLPASLGLVPHSALIDGWDALDAGLSIEADAPLRHLVVTLVDRLARLSGSLVDQAGRAVPNLPVVLAPTAREHWRAGSRRVRVERADSAGAFLFDDVPAGEYVLAVVSDIGESEQFDPAFLDLVIAAGVRVVLGETEAVVRDLRIGGAGSTKR